MSNRKRTREPPCRYTESAEGPSTKVARGAFSDLEDAQLLAALLKHGPLDMGKLTEMVPTRNDYQVKQRIGFLQRKAQQSLTTVQSGSKKVQPRQKVALDQWLDDLIELEEKAQLVHGSQDESHVRMLPTCLGLIAKYEDHPNPQECGGVDLKNVYEFLEHMMLGQPFKTLNKEESRFLIESLQRLSIAIDNNDVSKEIKFLLCGRQQWRTKGQRLRTYGKNSNSSDNEHEEDEPDERITILDSTKFNPFKVPKRLIRRSEPSKQ